MRKKILRKPGGIGYPLEGVCERCGMYAAEDTSDTQVQEHIEYFLSVCGICKTLTQVASPRDFGFPVFYTYANGSPVVRSK